MFPSTHPSLLILQKNAGHFLQLGCQVNLPQAPFALPSSTAVLNQVTKANASMAPGQLKVAWGHGIWCSQLSCQHLDAEFILTRKCQAQRNLSLPQKICMQYAAHTKTLAQGGGLLISGLRIFLMAYSHLYTFLVTQIQMWHGQKGSRYDM